MYAEICRNQTYTLSTSYQIGTQDRNECLLQDIDRRKLSFVGHVIRNKGLGCDLITGMVFGKRKRGRPKLRFVDNIKEIAGIGIARIVREEEDREYWRRFCRGATADRLNDLTV